MTSGFDPLMLTGRRALVTGGRAASALPSSWTSPVAELL